MENNKILRYYPYIKSVERYPDRYTNSVFEKFNELNTNIEFLNNYKKWKDGINYRTNKKITIGGKTHNELKYKDFMIHYRNDCNNPRSVLFEYLININASEYLQETKKIYDKIDMENDSIIKYNTKVNIIIEKIQKLKKWNQFIKFEGLKYGIPPLLNNIHYKNNCFGKMVYYMEKEHECKGCRDGMPCNGSYSCSCFTYNIQKCNNCGFIYDKKN